MTRPCSRSATGSPRTPWRSKSQAHVGTGTARVVIRTSSRRNARDATIGRGPAYSIIGVTERAAPTYGREGVRDTAIRRCVLGGVEPPTPRSSGAQNDANWPNCGELSQSAVAESIVGWTDLDSGAPDSASLGTPTRGVRWGRWQRTAGPSRRSSWREQWARRGGLLAAGRVARGQHPLGRSTRERVHDDLVSSTPRDRQHGRGEPVNHPSDRNLQRVPPRPGMHRGTRRSTIRAPSGSTA